MILVGQAARTQDRYRRLGGHCRADDIVEVRMGLQRVLDQLGLGFLAGVAIFGLHQVDGAAVDGTGEAGCCPLPPSRHLPVPGNQATLTPSLPDGCCSARKAPALPPISPKETSDLALNSGDDMPLITSITGMPLPRISLTMLLSPVEGDGADDHGIGAGPPRNPSICEIWLLSSV